MAIGRLRIKNFSAFEEAEFEFSPGINVLIGRNSTGKSHVLKLLYSLYKPSERGLEGPDSIAAKLATVFKPDDARIGRLVRRRRGRSKSEASISMIGGGSISAVVTTLSRLSGTTRAWRGGGRSLFLPTRDVLALYEGFISAYKNRELSFDETYYDACIALNALPLRSNKIVSASDVKSQIEKAIGGSVSLIGERFYLHQASGKLEAHLVAEGYRKMASLARFIENGAIEPDGILLWDEPESSLNPRLVRRVVDTILALAASNVQIFIASHDYLLTQRMSLASEDPHNDVDIRFFCLSRKNSKDPVRVESARTLSDIQDNPILREFARYYDDQRAMLDRSTSS
jgi:ABC-type branched-subunit amino acid transport system ATPase component